jgi:GDPmannose 4,6-dehydratase
LKIAIITGITGQDGAYLAQLLLQKQYKVIGLVRSIEKANTHKLAYLKIADQVELVACDLINLTEISQVIEQYHPTEIYNLAAQSSVSASFHNPKETLHFNIISVLHILEAIRVVNKSIKFYQASSSEMFGRVENLPISENTIFHPLSPYAISKVTAHHIAINYRESYHMFTCCGILFNHESYLRSDNFFMKKLLRSALDLQKGKIKEVAFGNLNIKRDFGFSAEYVEAMWLMMQQDKPDDFLICSGTSLKLFDIVTYIFNKLELPLDKIITNPALYRPSEIEDIYGTNHKAVHTLQWKCETNFYKVLDKLLEEEIINYEP